MSNPLSQSVALQIVQKLASGVAPPLEAVESVDIARGRWVDVADDMLGDVETTSDGMVRWVVGTYGEGKTHFLGMLRARALRRNWAVAFIDADKDLDGGRLERFESIFRAVVQTIAVKDAPDAIGFRAILDRWHQSLYKGSGAEIASGLKTFGGQDRLLRQASLTLDGIAAEPNFRNAVLEYLRSKDSDLERNHLAWSWFLGERINLRDRGVTASITKSTSRAVLASLVSFIRKLGCGGVAIFLDEVEVVMRLPQRAARQKAWQVLRSLIDNTDGPGKLRSACIYCAATPDLIDGERGFKEYPALRDRVISDVRFDTDQWIDWRASVLDLSRTPFEGKTLLALAKRMREIHGIARGWDPSAVVSDRTLQGVVRSVEKTAMGGATVARPRLLCTALVGILNICHDNGNAIDEGILETQIQKVAGALAQERRRGVEV